MNFIKRIGKTLKNIKFKIERFFKMTVATIVAIKAAIKGIIKIKKFYNEFTSKVEKENNYYETRNYYTEADYVNVVDVDFKVVN